MSTAAGPEEVDFAGLYGVGNIWGSFIDFELRYVDSHLENRSQLLRRPFRTVEIDYGGALGVSRVEAKDVLGAVRTSYNQQDLWIGRAFRFHGARAEEDRRKQLTVSGRVAVRDYVKRGPVAENTDRSLHDRTLMLAGVKLEPQRVPESAPAQNIWEYRRHQLRISCQCRRRLRSGRVQPPPGTPVHGCPPAVSGTCSATARG